MRPRGPGPRPEQPDEWQCDDRDGLHGEGDADEGRAPGASAGGCEPERGHDEPDHEGVVMGPGDEVHDYQRIEDCEPGGAHRIDAVDSGELRDKHHEEDDTRE